MRQPPLMLSILAVVMVLGTTSCVANDRYKNYPKNYYYLPQPLFNHIYRQRQERHHPHHNYSVPHRCSHIREPLYRQEWQPPIYKRCLLGYDDCGRPIYDQLLIRPGGWLRVHVGYRCRSCGRRL